ncbi:hypothetical protein H0H81_012666 [Sphagnurus paluster]|uniref:Uncharacterized protein n=1 Tax=Sphagnurus paluster TaxID=117069 RepID=A0A9P7KK61_9AGAR|nr:hypothetical protein H0H81_012666 [Sphagnurus paluster]
MVAGSSIINDDGLLVETAEGEIDDSVRGVEVPSPPGPAYGILERNELPAVPAPSCSESGQLGCVEHHGIQDDMPSISVNGLNGLFKLRDEVFNNLSAN